MAQSSIIELASAEPIPSLKRDGPRKDTAGECSNLPNPAVA